MSQTKRGSEGHLLIADSCHLDESSGDKLLAIEMVWEVIGKERAKANITYTKLKLYFSYAESTHENMLSLLHDNIRIGFISLGNCSSSSNFS